MIGRAAFIVFALLGKQIFYDAHDRRMNRDGYLSCASCHLDGDSDGRVWDFSDQGEGFRNTIALTGHGGTRQGFVHWSSEHARTVRMVVRYSLPA